MTGRNGGIVNEPWLIDALDKFFRNEHLAECVLAESRQRKEHAPKLCRDRRAIDGLGAPTMEVDEVILAHWRNKLGHNPLKDSGWVKYMKKHFPEVRVQSSGVKEIQVGYGSKSFGVTKKFTKTYA
jgi:hypothetical protein